MENPYIPNLAKIVETREETKGERSVKTFKTVFLDERLKDSFTYKPGQLAMLSVFGKGESMISITSSPTRKGFLEFSVLRIGRVTSALHQMEIGDIIGIRGPYGNYFPIEEWKGMNVVFIGGGIGQAPIRSAMNTILDNRKDFGKLTLIYGARTSNDLAFKNELRELEKRSHIEVHLSIDVAEPDWKGFVGFVPTNVLKVKPSPENAMALTCGPPIMIRFVVQNLEKLGFKAEQIYTTLENKMKCGIGKCGRCNIGNLYVCKDGPVFRYDRVRKLPPEY